MYTVGGGGEEEEEKTFFAAEALVTLTEKRASLFCGEIKARKCGEGGSKEGRHTRPSLFNQLAESEDTNFDSRNILPGWNWNS